MVVIFDYEKDKGALRAGPFPPPPAARRENGKNTCTVIVSSPKYAYTADTFNGRYSFLVETMKKDCIQPKFGRYKMH